MSTSNVVPPHTTGPSPHAKTALPELPEDINGARLPVVYEEAKRALAECSRLDECQQWADKAEAIASYARNQRTPHCARWPTAFRVVQSAAAVNC